MKCINCDKEAEYIYFGSSFCEEHFKKHDERVKAINLNKPVEGVPPYKVCPKCLESTPFSKTSCSSCGSHLVEWDLVCACGARINPWFRFGIFGLKPIPRDKHCEQCGQDTTKLVKAKVKEIRG